MGSYVFIDWCVVNVSSIFDSLAVDADTTTDILDRDQDGVTQIVPVLPTSQRCSSFQGSAGTLYLDDSVVTSSTLASHTSQRQTLDAALSEIGDLLLYGCEVAQGIVRQTFIADPRRYTGTDVADSTDYTGYAVLNGEMHLEAATAAFEALASTSLQSLRARAAL